MAFPSPASGCDCAVSSRPSPGARLSKSAMGVALACVATSVACLALHFDWCSSFDTVRKPAPPAWENGDTNSQQLTRFVWTKGLELREDLPQESNTALWDHADAKITLAKEELEDKNVMSNSSHLKGFAGPVDIHVQMLVHAAGTPSWGSCPDYYMGPRTQAAVPQSREIVDRRLTTPKEAVLGKRVNSRSYFVPWESDGPHLKKQKSEAQQLKKQKDQQVQETTDIEELVKLLVKVDRDEDANAERWKALDDTDDSASLDLDFAGLEGKSLLEEVDRPLLSKQEKLEAGNIDDFVKFVSVGESQEALRASNDAVDCLNGLDSVEVESDQCSSGVPPIHSVEEEPADSNLIDSTEEQGSRQVERSSPVQSVEDSAVAKPDTARLPRLPRVDPRIFVPHFSVRIDGGAASELNQPSRPPPISWTAPFLVGPIPPTANTTPSVSRRSRVQRWQDKRKQRSKARPMDSYVSEVRRAGAAAKPRDNGRFVSTGARFVSVTSLQQ